jgi:hypothetical protein
MSTGKSIKNAAGTALLTEAGVLDNVALGSSVTATVAEIGGVHTTGSVSASATALTVASGSGISDGDFVVGEGITPGTTVASGGGTVNIVLSANANVALSTDPVSFYSATKAVTPGVLGGRLCRAWVNFNGTGTVAIRSSFNVSSLEDDGTGTYIIHLTNALSSTDDVAVVSGQMTWSEDYANTSACKVTSTTTILCLTSDYNASGYVLALLYDNEFVNIIVF